MSIYNAITLRTRARLSSVVTLKMQDSQAFVETFLSKTIEQRCQTAAIWAVTKRSARS